MQILMPFIFASSSTVVGVPQWGHNFGTPELEGGVHCQYIFNDGCDIIASVQKLKISSVILNYL